MDVDVDVDVDVWKSQKWAFVPCMMFPSAP